MSKIIFEEMTILNGRSRRFGEFEWSEDLSSESKLNLNKKKSCNICCFDELCSSSKLYIWKHFLPTNWLHFINFFLFFIINSGTKVDSVNFVFFRSWAQFQKSYIKCLTWDCFFMQFHKSHEKFSKRDFQNWFQNCRFEIIFHFYG